MILAAVAAVTLNSCSKNEISNETPSNQSLMDFGTYMGQSKATSEIAFAQDDVFKTDVYYTEQTAFASMTAAPEVWQSMDGVVVKNTTPTVTDDNWEYSPKKPWPNVTNDKLSFFAVTIADNEANSTILPDLTIGANSASFEWTNPATAAAQRDLMADAQLDQTKANPTVVFAFDHVLSQINFEFKTFADYSGSVDVTLTGVTVSYGDNFEAEASYNMLHTPAAGTTGWTLPASVATKQANETFNSFLPAADLGVLNNTTATTLDSPIMIIPQDQPVNITVNYTIDGLAQSFTTTTSITPAGGFAQGTNYTYPVTISLTMIEFGEPSITGWTTAAGGNININ